jgi:hypothetical protein
LLLVLLVELDGHGDALALPGDVVELVVEPGVVVDHALAELADVVVLRALDRELAELHLREPARHRLRQEVRVSLVEADRVVLALRAGRRSRGGDPRDAPEREQTRQHACRLHRTLLPVLRPAWAAGAGDHRPGWARR